MSPWLEPSDRKRGYQVVGRRREEATVEARARSFRQAGVVYLLAGVTVVVFTLAAGLVPPTRVARLLLLLPGVAFVVFFAAIILLAPALWRWPWTFAPTLWLVRLLALTSVVRTLAFLANAGGAGIQVMPASGQVIAAVPHEPNPLYLFNAGLTGLIAVMLARAGWTRA